jgi:pimeloyl-ACP methyl ester carboxylesterase
VASGERIPYDELGLFRQNAEEFGLPWDGPPTVRREDVEVEPGRRLSALVWGEGEPELVLLHGGGQNAHTWDTVAMALRPRPLVALDLPGHGHADGPGERQLAPGGGPREAAADVAVALRALAPRAHGVVGMSFGGLTAIALAAAAPELVRRLVLVDVLPGLSAEHARHIGAFLDGPPTFASFDDLLARTMAFNPLRSESSLRRGILHNALQLPDGSWVWRHARWRRGTGGEAGAGGPAAAGEGRADAARTTLHEELAGDLAGLRMPVLLARGIVR